MWKWREINIVFEKFRCLIIIFLSFFIIPEWDAGPSQGNTVDLGGGRKPSQPQGESPRRQ